MMALARSATHGIYAGGYSSLHFEDLYSLFPLGEVSCLTRSYYQASAEWHSKRLLHVKEARMKVLTRSH